jgi:hypothetical protein
MVRERSGSSAWPGLAWPVWATWAGSPRAELSLLDDEAVHTLLEMVLNRTREA